jgi:LacI family transcriptional regulator
MANQERPLIAIGIELDWPLPHHYDLVRGITTYGGERGWICRVEPGLETSTRVDELPAAYDGIIARATPELAAHCRRRGIPLVNVWNNSSDHTVPRVSVNHERLGELAAEHLIQRGFRNFGLIARAGDITAQVCMQAAESVIRRNGFEAGVMFQSSMPTELHDWAQYRADLTKWLATSELPVAVIASDHIIARHFVDQCVATELWVPDDVAVISCQDNELVCGGIEPTITAIECGFEAAGGAAAELLAAMLGGAEATSGTSIAPFSGYVVERRSTDVRPVPDRVVARALRYIWDNSHLPIGVDDVAHSAGMSRRSLERRFRNVLDQSVNDKIIESRIERAKRILRDTDDPIKLVAVDAGFSNSESMARVFSTRVGISPSRYRASRQDLSML